jgi:hypothetical protein
VHGRSSRAAGGLIGASAFRTPSRWVRVSANGIRDPDSDSASGDPNGSRVAEITASAFPLTRVPPLLGRPLQPTDETPGAEPVAVLGYDGRRRRGTAGPCRCSGRLANGASWQAAAAELELVTTRLAAENPATHAQLRRPTRGSIPSIL